MSRHNLIQTLDNYIHLMRNLAPLPATHAHLPQAVFRQGAKNPPDQVRLLASLDKSKDTCVVTEAGEKIVVPTIDQVKSILQDPVACNLQQRPVGLSLYSTYSAIMRLNMVKHLYYLPATYGRFPSAVNLVEDGIPYHYIMNPSSSMTLDSVKELYTKIGEVAPGEYSQTHDAYIEYLSKLPAGSITPWRKVPLYGTDQARDDESFIANYGEISPPLNKQGLQAVFGDVIKDLPIAVVPLAQMCMSKAIDLFEIYEVTTDDETKDELGLQITRLVDTTRNVVLVFRAMEKPRIASYSSATPYAYSPTFSYNIQGARMYSTVAYQLNPMTLLSPDIVKEFREYFLQLCQDGSTNEEKAADLMDDLYRLSFTIEHIDKCGLFGITPCPFEGGWAWNK